MGVHYDMLSSMRSFLVALLLLLCLVDTAGAATGRASTLADLASSAARIFRGVCEHVEIGSVIVAGARLPVTTYTFRVSEGLKGGVGATLTFRQIGTPGGGPADLGQRAGLPAYSIGGDYLLFLLPPSRVGLTSPAGAAQGAFEILGDQARELGPTPLGPRARSYRELRQEVLQAVPR